MAGRRQQGPVERATRKHLSSLGAKATESGLAAAALSLARHVDTPDSTSAAAAAARQLHAILSDLAKEASKRPAKDKVDELDDRRNNRRRTRGA